jgi:CRP-like cAMP-binding protein
MTSDPTLDVFLVRWRAALDGRETGVRTYWEGQKAFSDLQRTGYLERVRLKEAGRDEEFGSKLEHRFARVAVQEICAELAIYRRGMRQVRERIERQKGQNEWLAKHAIAFRKKAERVAKDDPLLAHDLRDLAGRMIEVNRTTQLRVKKSWSLPSLSFAYPMPETVIPNMSQETLAEMIGTTRSRVSFFMNRFRTLGFVDYDRSGLKVHSSLLNIVLHD